MKNLDSNNNKITAKSFYIKDFLKNLMKPRNIPIIIYLLIDSMFIFAALMLTAAIFLDNNIENETAFLITCIIVSITIYLGAIALSLSPIGEAFLRLKQKCKPIKEKEILDRMEPLFQEVYQKAKLLDPKISNIKNILFNMTNRSNNSNSTEKNNF